ncbi:redox-regulated ATPase YchF [Candidatus Woesearchaeota archaeon]|nr:redox-regulated ATPase YchF [Candidatus Woesearchaeota archaeon]HIH54228.1 redox-regulated ATPase YchF [Candidatus Woesearchaeota archaeon]HIJ02203.1 redox-regulated ATPase YchF [Candidatus Woesearchaeota archaeon]HIJ13924.1 redox-regulated ATPase YchF [Candidatus Woesearchaeota archaeon]
MMQIGIIGKPNTGKSTFFKAATLMDVLIANYPFATIKPNHGVGFVKIDCVDTFFKTQCNPREGFCVNHKRFVPVDIIDVAGLVPGAHEGKGLGNQFLDDLRQADALIHLVDFAGTTNEKGESIEAGSYDPVNDIIFLAEEIDYWYLGIINKGWERFARQIQQEHTDPAKALGKQLSGLKVTEEMVEDVIRKLNLPKEKLTSWTEDDLMNIAKSLRKITKPMIIAANKMDIPIANENYKRIRAEYPELIIVPCSAESELALKEAAKHQLIKYIPGDKDFEFIDESKLSEKQKAALNFIKENVLKQFVEGTGVQNCLNAAVFNLLKYIAIFPGGVSKLTDQYGRVLPDCFLMPLGTTALDFAFKLHSDFGNNFIKAIDVKKKLPVGKDHVLNNGDVIEIHAAR